MRSSKQRILNETDKIEFGARSDTGHARQNNEDSLAMSPEMSLFIVSDGMGGLASGEIASRLAVDTVLTHCRQSDANATLALIGERIEGVSQTSNRLASAVRLANQVLQKAARENVAHYGMGATIAAVRCEGDRLSIAHVGDSRAYRLRDNRLEQLTQDHSFVAEQVRQGEMTEREASHSNLQNVLVRALGIDADVEVDVTEDLLLDGDTILLCTDGLTREVSDSQIAAVLLGTRDAQEAADHLVDLANESGGRDNITAIVLRPSSLRAGAFARMGRLGKWLGKFGSQS
jgi:protein phosphatase